MRKNSIKNTRVNAEVQRELSNILRAGIKDPRVAPMTSVVAVEVAPDLKTCKAYISVLGDEKAQQEACPDDEEDVLAAGEHGADPLAHRRHAHLRAQRKEHDAHNDHSRAQQEAEQDAGGDGSNGEAEHQHDGHDGQHRLKRFQ